MTYLDDHPPRLSKFDPRVFVSVVRTVEGDWLDYNGHMNMAYYNVLFDGCVDDAFMTFGLGPDYVADYNASYFTLEAHVTYLGEIGGGDETICTFQILDFDAKRVHFFQELHRVSDGLLSATSEQMCMHVDMTTRRSAPFPPDILEKIAKMAAGHADIPRMPQVGHVIGIPKR
ncbi:MAG: thioesterase family protein [Rhodobiaceae bacterium]|nr:thioesterase family protein [Rhodobiaceae bacterium]